MNDFDGSVGLMCQDLELMSWLLVSDNFGGAGGAAQKDAGRLYAAVRFEPCGRRTTPQHRVDGTSIAGEIKKLLATVFANRRHHRLIRLSRRLRCP